MDLVTVDNANSNFASVLYSILIVVIIHYEPMFLFRIYLSNVKKKSTVSV